jgi:hypothetical protein
MNTNVDFLIGGSSVNKQRLTHLLVQFVQYLEHLDWYYLEPSRFVSYNVLKMTIERKMKWMMELVCLTF